MKECKEYIIEDLNLKDLPLQKFQLQIQITKPFEQATSKRTVIRSVSVQISK